MPDLIDNETFQRLSAPDVAKLVRKSGPKVCVFPINGTRRWFMLEHPIDPDKDFATTFLDVITRRHIEIYQLFFDHGVDTLLTPALGPDIMERGEGYMRMATEGLSHLATCQDFLDFYAAYRVRVRFYGDYRRFLGPTPYAYLIELFDELMAQTRDYDQHRLFFGLFAHDAAETVAEIAIRFYQEHGHSPNKRQIIRAYYGEHVPPVDFFIGFDKFAAFDMPLIATGNEDLYFTISPSPYINARQLRHILYDHLYTRREEETDYATMEPKVWSLMREFYRANLDKTLGIGAKQKRAGFWYPLPQVELPEGFSKPLRQT